MDTKKTNDDTQRCKYGYHRKDCCHYIKPHTIEYPMPHEHNCYDGAYGHGCNNDYNGGHENDHDHHHYLENINHALANNQQRQRFYQYYQNHVVEHQQAERLHLLKCTDCFLDTEVRNILNCSQTSLCHYGYNTGIHEERTTNTNNAIESESFVDAISLHLNDVPVSGDKPPSKNAKSNNQIRFSKIDNSREIECQFTTSKTRSKPFYLILDERGKNHTLANVEALVFDFINFILMTRRLGVVNLS